MYINILVYYIIMNIEMINQILELNEAVKKNVPKKKRIYYKYMRAKGRPFIGIAGLKGVGKTILLRQYLISHINTIYISLDSIQILDLFEIVKYFVENRNINTFLLDEVHFYKNWKQDLKKIYDFLNVNIFFTSSVSIDIIKSKYDLSRRTITKIMYPFSLKEYIYFVENIKIDNLSFKDLENINKLNKIANFDYLFDKYMNGGLLPAFLGQTDVDIFKNIALSIIERDLPRVENWNLEDIENVKNMLKFIASSTIDGISYSSLSKNLNITKYKAKKYVQALEKSFILNVIEPKGTNVSKEPKILFMPPFRLVFSKNKEYDVGAKREEFFILNMVINNILVFYLKSIRGEKMPDYLIKIKDDKYVFEIGGINKKYLQLKNIPVKNKYILTIPSVIQDIKKPLIFFGFLC